MRRPLDTNYLGGQGAELIFKLADRTAWQVELAMDDFNFWVIQVAQIIGETLGATGGFISVVGRAKALIALKNETAQSTRHLLKITGRAAASASPKSIDQVLMGCRNEAYRITHKLVQQDLAAGAKVTPQRFGDIVDAVFKSLVQQAKQEGVLPKTIRTAPPPVSIAGGQIPKKRAIDVWDSATGIGWDVTKATVSDVAKHEKYIGVVMPDATKIKDVRPLVYY